MSDDRHYPELSPFSTGLKGRCPRCGDGPLFDGFLETGKKCPACGLDFGFVDSADGPAVFIMFIVGFIVVGLALMVELSYQPPIWLHMVLWIPLILILSLGLLRPLKGITIALQYVNRAREGRLGDDHDDGDTA
ncbi:MAG: hypothetical protein C0606_15910 [Hyphomicrobiales bacterium]|nr:MAG: hypothetical protein C0606_15910 [Hyphomicrobiales bacterium]